MDIEEEQGITFLKVNRFEIEENAVFLDFNVQEIVKNIINYRNLKIYHRLSLAKNIETIVSECKDREAISKLFIMFTTDNEEIQRELIQYLRGPGKNNFQHEEQELLVLQPLMSLIKGNRFELKEIAGSLLSEVSHRLNSQQKKGILKFAMDLGRTDEEENKIVSIQLIAKMTPDMSIQENQLFFKQQYVALYKDSSVRIRKEVINSACVIAKNVSKEFVNREIIDGFFIEKCKEAVWGVRKACVEIMAQLVQLTDSRKQLLSQMLLSLTKDGNKIVKIAAFKAIPEFIANYNSQKVPDKLVDIYLHLIDHDVNQSVSRENEIIMKVAYYFPGVVHTLGVTRWEQMKKLFNRLILFKSLDVKLPIAASLHEISRIIGSELSKEYMFAALDTILKDHSDTLKLSAISHLSEFVELFDKATQQNLIDVFLVLQKDPKKWRVRHSIAHQLTSLSKIYDTEIVFKYIFPISLKLCNDNVNEVRQEAALQMYYIIENMADMQMLQEMALESVKGYGLSEKYIQRQTFTRMVRNLYRIANFETKLMQLVLQLAKDKILLVRIALAFSIKQILDDDSTQRVTFAKIIDIFQKDQDDISQYFV